MVKTSYSVQAQACVDNRWQPVDLHRAQQWGVVRTAVGTVNRRKVVFTSIIERYATRQLAQDHVDSMTRPRNYFAGLQNYALGKRMKPKVALAALLETTP